jgi:hypothetical protein
MQPRTSFYTGLIDNFYTPDQELAQLALSMPDDKLAYMLGNSLKSSEDFWNQAPWSLEETDKQTLPYFTNVPTEDNLYTLSEDDFSDNRLMRGIRSIVAYTTARLAQPMLTSTDDDEQAQKQAQMVARALYQHSMNDQVDQKFRTMALNHLLRKRAFLKLRFDQEAGKNGDMVTEHIPPEDIILDYRSAYMGKLPVIHQRVRASLDELVSSFPGKKDELFRLFQIKQGRFSQLSREITYIETWYSYFDHTRTKKEGVTHWLPGQDQLILDNEPNPNWIYTGDPEQDKLANVTAAPPKPYIFPNYLNLGRVALDETSLFNQAYPQQKLLDKRIRQYHQGVDYANGRWLADKNVLSEGEAGKMINKGPRTIGMIDNKNKQPLDTILGNVAPKQAHPEVYQSIQDLRNEIDTLLGTNAVFNGSQTASKGTLGRDLLLNQQASSLQDDIVRSLSHAARDYYRIKLQMARVYWTDQTRIPTQGSDGSDLVLTLSGQDIDPNLTVTIDTDSMLPKNKQQISQDAKDLFIANKLDALSAFQDMGYDDAEVRAERLYKSQTDPMGYQQSIERGLDNNQAETDINQLMHGLEPKARDHYDQDYLDYYNLFMTTPRFSKLEPQIQQQIVAHLTIVQQIMATQAGLQQAMLDEAGMQQPVLRAAVPGQQPDQPPAPDGQQQAQADISQPPVVQ